MFRDCTAFGRIIRRISADAGNLETVNMNGKRLDDERLARLSEVLSYNTSVTSLELSNNNIGHKGARSLADALQLNLYIEHIDLSGNDIGNKGAVALAECLQHNNISLISLDLQNNGIEYEGAIALLSAVSTNKTIHSINLKGNYIPSSLLSKIDEALNRSKAMFEREVVYFSSPTKDQDLAAVDTFSITLSESEGSNHSFDSSTTDVICMEVSNNCIFQGAQKRSPSAESSSLSPLNAQGMAINCMSMIGSFFHNGEKNKETSEGSNVSKVIPVSNDEGYYQFLAFVQNKNASHTTKDHDVLVADSLSTTSSQSDISHHSLSDYHNVDGAKHLSEEMDKTSASPQHNPTGTSFNRSGSLFYMEASEEEKIELRKIPVIDDERYMEFLAFLATPSPNQSAEFQKDGRKY